MEARMNDGEILSIVLREMTAYGRAWRGSWHDFDGRTLCAQLNDLAEWAELARKDQAVLAADYKEGTEFCEDKHR